MPPYKLFDKEIQEWQLNDSLMLKNQKLLTKIHQQSRKKSISYIQSQQKNHRSRPQSSPSPSIDIRPSINELRQMATQEKLQTSKIQNRLKYLNVSSERQEKLVNTAKEKFIKITEVRRQSFTEKSFLSRERKSLLQQHSKTVHLKASAIKSERIRTTESQQKAYEQKKSKASEVKKERQLNESIIRDQKEHQKQLKSQKVIKVQQQEQISRQKSEIRAKQKVQQGKNNHKSVIMRQYEQVQRQMKMRKNMMRSFEDKALKIFNKKQKHERQLQQYRAYLGLDKSQLSFSKVNHTTGSECRSPRKSEPIIDDAMLFKLKQKKSSNVQNPGKGKQIHSASSNYNDEKLKGRKQDIYLTNPENWH